MLSFVKKLLITKTRRIIETVLLLTTKTVLNTSKPFLGVTNAFFIPSTSFRVVDETMYHWEHGTHGNRVNHCFSKTMEQQ